MNNKRRISSSLTSVYKYYYVIFALVMGFVIVYTFFKEFNPSNWLALVLVMLVLLIAYSIFKNFLLNLKHVDLDAEFLYIRQRKRKEKIALSNIKSVRQISPQIPQRIEIQFSSKTIFGTEIMFLAKTKFIWLSTHPIVHELQSIIEQDQAQNELRQLL